MLNHTADFGILVRGKDIKNVFKKAAFVMMHIMVDGKTTERSKETKLSIDGKDLPELMVNWLGEILYLFNGEKEVVNDIQIDAISRSHLDATLKISPFEPDLHEILREIKAVTYHQIEVAKKNDCWETKIIFDM